MSENEYRIIRLLKQLGYQYCTSTDDYFKNIYKRKWIFFKEYRCQLIVDVCNEHSIIKDCKDIRITCDNSISDKDFIELIEHIEENS